jgi:hypothetical protein
LIPLINDCVIGIKQCNKWHDKIKINELCPM